MFSDFYDEFQPCFLITSKGYPDMATRSFLTTLYEKYPKLPMFALVDSDPHGIGIYLTYKYGSQNSELKSGFPKVPSIPSLKLIGVLPSDLPMLQLKRKDLLEITNADKAVIQSIKNRRYYGMEKGLQSEVDQMENSHVKAEIQCLEGLGSKFLCSEYLPRKLKQENIFSTKQEPKGTFYSV